MPPQRTGSDLETSRKTLAASRPTAVNLGWALGQVQLLLIGSTEALLGVA